MPFFYDCLLIDSFILSIRMDTALFIFALRNYFPLTTCGFSRGGYFSIKPTRSDERRIGAAMRRLLQEACRRRS